MLWILINSCCHGNWGIFGLALYLKMFVIVNAITMPSFMLVSKRSVGFCRGSRVRCRGSRVEGRGSSVEGKKKIFHEVYIKILSNNRLRFMKLFCTNWYFACKQRWAELNSAKVYSSCLLFIFLIWLFGFFFSSFASKQYRSRPENLAHF